MLHTLNLHDVTCSLCLNKAGGKRTRDCPFLLFALPPIIPLIPFPTPSNS